MEKIVREFNNIQEFINKYNVIFNNKKEKVNIEDIKFIIVDDMYLCAIEGVNKPVYPLTYVNGLCIEKCIPIPVSRNSKIRRVNDIHNACMYNILGLENLKDVI